MLDSAEMWKQALSENHFTRYNVACELYSDDCEASTEILQHLASDPDMVVRLSAVSSIERRRFDGYIPMLVRMMHEDADQLVRRSCMNSLIYIPAGAAFVVDALDDPDDRVVAITILTLQQTGSMWASNAVAECLMHRNWWVRYLAACALLEFNRSSQILVDAIQGLRDVSEAQEMVRNSTLSDTMSIALANTQPQTDHARNIDIIQWDAAQRELYGADHMVMDVDERLEVLRAKYGPELVQYPQADPLGDMLKQAQQLLEQS